MGSAHISKGDPQLSFALAESLGARLEAAPADRAGASLGPLRLPVRAVGFSIAFVGGSGSRSGSSSGSLPALPVSGCRPNVNRALPYRASRTGSMKNVSFELIPSIEKHDEIAMACEIDRVAEMGGSYLGSN